MISLLSSAGTRAARRRIRIREATPDDIAALEQVFAGLSAEARRLRYLTPVPRLTAAMRRALLDVAPDRHVLLIAEVRGRAVGLARYVVDGRGRAELAYEVVDAWQGCGVGTRLLRRLVAIAGERGIVTLHGSLLPQNEASLALLRRVLPQVKVRVRAGALEVEAPLAGEPLTIEDLAPVA